MYMRTLKNPQKNIWREVLSADWNRKCLVFPYNACNRSMKRQNADLYKIQEACAWESLAWKIYWWSSLVRSSICLSGTTETRWVLRFSARHTPDPGENAVGDGCPVRDGLCTTDDFFYKIYRIDNNGDGHGSCFEKMAAGRAEHRWLCVVWWCWRWWQPA